MRQVVQLLSFIAAVLFITCNSSGQSVRSVKLYNEVIDNYVIRTDFSRYFDQCGVRGSVVIYDHSKQQWIVSDSVGANTRNLPASTFKIINLLIFLETKTIADENAIVKWPGATETVKYGYRPDIYHDISVKSAFELSAG